MNINKKMMRNVGIGVVVAAALLLISNAVMAAETAVWQSFTVSGTPTPGLSLDVKEELRFASGDGGLSLVQQSTDISLSTDAVSDLVNVVVGYRNTSRGEHRPYVGLGLNLLRGEVSLCNLTKLELRDFDTWRGRTELTASMNVGGVTPWVSEEVFVGATGVTGNRASVGVTKGLNKLFSVRGFYLLNSTGEGLGNHAHVLGLGLGVTL